MDDDPKQNPFAAPQTSSKTTRPELPINWAVSNFTTLMLVACMVMGHIYVRNLDHNERPAVFIATAAVLLFWPIACALLPRNFLVPALLFPFWGIWLGVRYTGDMGQSYMFEAQPPCWCGLWSYALGGAILAFRLRGSKNTAKENQDCESG